MKILTRGSYYGEKKIELKSNGIILSEYNYHIPKTDWHYHENPYFMYMLQGNVFDINKKRKSLCPPGSFLFHNWNDIHCNTKESKFAKGFHIEFDRAWFDARKLNISLWEGSRLIEDPKMHHLLGKLYYEFKCRDQFSEASIDILLLQLCESTQDFVDASFNKEPSWVLPLKELLHSSTDKITLTMLSETLGVHPVHLSRSIPKYLASTLGEYIRREKIKKALNFLMNPKHSLTEIAYLSGFSDHSHFTRTFKIYFQKTPKDFRRKLFAC